MKELLLEGIITATSMKQDERFKSDNPRKSVYFELDEENTKKAKEFGLTEYEGKDGGKFFIVKASENVAVYTHNDTPDSYVSGKADDDSKNFKTKGKSHLAIVKGNNLGNDFYRLHAIMGEIEEVAPTNPFADLMKAPDLELDDEKSPF